MLGVIYVLDDDVNVDDVAMEASWIKWVDYAKDKDYELKELVEMIGAKNTNNKVFFTKKTKEWAKNEFGDKVGDNFAKTYKNILEADYQVYIGGLLIPLFVFVEDNDMMIIKDIFVFDSEV